LLKEFGSKVEPQVLVISLQMDWASAQADFCFAGFTDAGINASFG
jgi:hypothetical protein